MEGQEPCYDAADMIGFALFFRRLNPTWNPDQSAWNIPLAHDVDVDLEPNENMSLNHQDLIRYYLKGNLNQYEDE